MMKLIFAFSMVLSAQVAMGFSNSTMGTPNNVPAKAKDEINKVEFAQQEPCPYRKGAPSGLFASTAFQPSKPSFARLTGDPGTAK